MEKERENSRETHRREREKKEMRREEKEENYVEASDVNGFHCKREDRGRIIPPPHVCIHA